MKIKAYKSFKKAYKILPQNIQDKVDRQIEILQANYLYPSLHTKKIKGAEGIWEARVDIHFRMTFEIIGDTIFLVFKENETYVAYCPELDVSSCGNTVEHAKEMLKTAVRLFLEEAEKMGTAEDILEEAHYVKDASGKWTPPKLIATEIASI